MNLRTKLIRGFVLISAGMAVCAPILGQDAKSKVTPETAQTPTGPPLVNGRAVYDDTGQPAKRYCIHLVPIEALSNSSGRVSLPTNCTDENGAFRLRKVPVGDYYVVTRAIDDHSSNTRNHLFPRPTDDAAADAAKLEQFKKEHVRITVDGRQPVVVSLRVHNFHFGTIAGRVVDAAGLPATQSTVHLTVKDGKPFGLSTRTDEQGEYKFWGLQPGEYLISANPPPTKRDEEQSTRKYEGVLGATYFPSTFDSRSSTPVMVLADADTRDINITLLAKNLHSVSGAVRMRGDNQPVSGAIVHLNKKDPANEETSGVQPAAAFYSSETDKNGRWSIANLPDGDYRLSVGETAILMTHGPRFVSRELNITVAGTDIEDLSVAVSQGARISGIVSVEGGNSPPQHVIVDVSDYQARVNSSIELNEIGAFAFLAAPSGEVQISAFVKPQEKFYVKSIEANGLDLLRTKLTLHEGDEIKNIQIVISPNVGVVTGHVLSLGEDKPVAGAHIMLRRITEDGMRLYGGKLSGVADERGAFMLSAAPGDYVIVAWRQSDGSSAFGVALGKALKDPNARISFSSPDRKQLDIRIP